MKRHHYNLMASSVEMNQTRQQEGYYKKSGDHWSTRRKLLRRKGNKAKQDLKKRNETKKRNRN
jgi:hypothetical protein